MRHMNQLMHPRYARSLALSVGRSGEPDSNRRSPGPEPGGLPAFPPPETIAAVGDDRSAQRESNPHVRLGKAVGYRYIMGTICSASGLSRFREHRAGVEPAPPRYERGVLACWTTSAWPEWDRRGSNPHLPG